MSDEQTPTRGRPRRSETDDLVVHTTQDLLREHGPGAVSIAAVSARSGLARTTIYRRYADRQALLVAALRPLAEQGVPDPGLTLEEKADWVLARARDVLDRGIGLGGVGSVLAGSDPEFAVALRASLEQGLRPVLARVQEDVAAGLLPDFVDPGLLLDLLLGAYLARSVRGGATDAAWRRRTSALVGRMLGPT